MTSKQKHLWWFPSMKSHLQIQPTIISPPQFTTIINKTKKERNKEENKKLLNSNQPIHNWFLLDKNHKIDYQSNNRVYWWIIVLRTSTSISYCVSVGVFICGAQQCKIYCSVSLLDKTKQNRKENPYIKCVMILSALMSLSSQHLMHT